MRPWQDPETESERTDLCLVFGPLRCRIPSGGPLDFVPLRDPLGTRSGFGQPRPRIVDEGVGLRIVDGPVLEFSLLPEGIRVPPL